LNILQKKHNFQSETVKFSIVFVNKFTVNVNTERQCK